MVCAPQQRYMGKKSWESIPKRLSPVGKLGGPQTRAGKPFKTWADSQAFRMPRERHTEAKPWESVPERLSLAARKDLTQSTARGDCSQQNRYPMGKCREGMGGVPWNKVVQEPGPRPEERGDQKEDRRSEHREAPVEGWKFRAGPIHEAINGTGA